MSAGVSRGHRRVRIDKTYTFETVAGPRTLAELFDGRSQLLVYHLMDAPSARWPRRRDEYDEATAAPGDTIGA